MIFTAVNKSLDLPIKICHDVLVKVNKHNKYAHPPNQKLSKSKIEDIISGKRANFFVDGGKQ